jgi:hypothetical protein
MRFRNALNEELALTGGSDPHGVNALWASTEAWSTVPQ